MTRESLNQTELTHLHDPEVEGPLPNGFPERGREGKVRNVYEYGALICLIASDRVSAFDQVSPSPIPGKGELLNDIARRELEAAEAAYIPTWFHHVPENNPRAAVGVRAEVMPVEMIFRNYMTGSMWRAVRDKTGTFDEFDLPEGVKEWHHFKEPLFTPSTKSDIKDVNFHPNQVEEMTGVDRSTLDRMEAIGRKLFDLGTARALERGLILVDTKYEIGRSSDGELIIIDEVHTPDSSRFVMAEGFEETVASGEKPKSLSKEFLRQIMLERAGGDEAAAKKMMEEPLPDEIVRELFHRYRELRELFTA